MCLIALHRQAQATLASLRPGVRFGFHYCDDTSSSNLARDKGPHTGGERPPRRGHGAPGHGSGEVLESLVFGAESIKFHFHAGVLGGQLLHFLLQLCLLLLQFLLLGNTLDSAAGRVAPVLQRAPTLLQLDDLLL